MYTCTLITSWRTKQSVFIFKDPCENLAEPVEEEKEEEDDDLIESGETDDKDDSVLDDKGTCMYV